MDDNVSTSTDILFGKHERILTAYLAINNKSKQLLLIIMSVTPSTFSHLQMRGDQGVIMQRGIQLVQTLGLR